MSERIAALKEEQMSLMPLEFYETVDKTVAALRERIATLEKQLSMLVADIVQRRSQASDTRSPCR